LCLVPASECGHGERMEMHQVRYFLAVADTLNFTRAAERCHVSQPALTRAIQQLEEEMGGLLLRRERKLTHLTDFGRLIEPHLRQLSADAEDWIQMILAAGFGVCLLPNSRPPSRGCVLSR
jgi:DNA-binding transcriptional LysR family regulator